MNLVGFYTKENFKVSQEWIKKVIEKESSSEASKTKFSKLMK